MYIFFLVYGKRYHFVFLLLFMFYDDEFEWLLGNFVNYKSVLYVDICIIVWDLVQLLYFSIKRVVLYILFFSVNHTIDLDFCLNFKRSIFDSFFYEFVEIMKYPFFCLWFFVVKWPSFKCQCPVFLGYCLTFFVTIWVIKYNKKRVFNKFCNRFWHKKKRFL